MSRTVVRGARQPIEDPDPGGRVRNGTALLLVGLLVAITAATVIQLLLAR